MAGMKTKDQRMKVLVQAARKARAPLLLVMLFLFIVSVAVPDPLPWVDEIILGLLTVLLGSGTDRSSPPEMDNKHPSAFES